MGPSSPYQEASDLVNKIIESSKNRNLKSFFYDAKGSLTCTSRTYALVSNVIKHRNVLSEVASNISNKIQAKNVGLLWVLLFELLLGSNKSMEGGGYLKRTILENEDAIRDAFDQARKKFPDDLTLVEPNFPRYIRLNSYNRTNEDLKVIIERLQKLGSPVYIDNHIPDLLVMPQEVTPALLKHEQQEKLKQQKNGHEIVLQDKSSCFPALCLVYGYSSVDDTSDVGDFLDACAAPGNKTSHLAALLYKKHNEHTKTDVSGDKESIEIIALDRDQVRFKLLKKRMQELVPYNNAGSCSIDIKVTPVHKDFLKTDPSDYGNVRSILLDPSCSGSGVVSSSESHHLSDDTKDHRDKLVGFQITALRHAMSFPNVRRIVYSTCSIHSEENEQVIAAALGYSVDSKEDQQFNDKNSTGTMRDQWEVISPFCLAQWKRRGQKVKMSESEHQGKKTSIFITKPEAECMIRVDPNEDETNGFFVCCLQRRNIPTSSTVTTSAKKKKKVSSPATKSKEELFSHDRFGLEEYQPHMFPSERPLNDIVTSKENDEDKNSKTKIEQTKKSTVADNSKKSSEVGQSNKAGKKRQKKMEWKAKQNEQKHKRLKTTQDANTKVKEANTKAKEADTKAKEANTKE